MAYLQYTSGRPAQPAGVVVSHKNIFGQFRTGDVRLLRGPRQCSAAGHHVVSWLPFYHDMGLILEFVRPILAGRQAVLMSPMAFLQRAGPVDAIAGQQSQRILGSAELRFRIGGATTSDDDMAGLDLGDVLIRAQR